MVSSLIEIRVPPNEHKYMDAFSCYRFYVSMKAHFNSSYDIVKYNWNSKRITESIYKKRIDKLFFENLSKRFTVGEIYKILFINFLENPDAWIGELSATDSIMFYYENYGKIERATYLFTEEIENILFYCEQKGIHFKKVMEVDNNGQSILFKMVQKKVVSYETFILLDQVLNFTEKLDSGNDIIWFQYKKRINGYRKLLKLNESKIKEIIVKTIKQNTKEKL